MIRFGTAMIMPQAFSSEPATSCGDADTLSALALEQQVQGVVVLSDLLHLLVDLTVCEHHVGPQQKPVVQFVLGALTKRHVWPSATMMTIPNRLDSGRARNRNTYPKET